MKEDETKMIEHYDYWQCEKCKYHASSFEWDTCPDCRRTIIERVALDAGVVW